MQANQEKVRRRRKYSVAFKLAAVRASQEPGASLSGVALARGLNANLLRRWVGEARSGTLRLAMTSVALTAFGGGICSAASDGRAARSHSHHAAARCHYRAGGLALDPTNNLVVGPDHVTLAWGRDYADVAPLRGMINGGARAEPLVSVNVEAVA